MKCNRIVKFLLCSVVGLSTISVWAEDKSGGCGLGWQVTQKHSMLATTTRGTTNMVVPNTFGMTSGTIGCDQHSFAKREAPAVNYAVSNYENILLEMAQGKGEYLQAMARTMGCSDDMIDHFSRMTQKNYQSIIPSNNDSAVDMYINLKSQVQADPMLALGCQA